MFYSPVSTGAFSCLALSVLVGCVVTGGPPIVSDPLPGPARSLTPNTEIAATLSAQDPLLGGKTRYHLWTFPGTQGQRIVADMMCHGCSFDPYLILLSPNFLELQRDYDSGQGKDARLSHTLPLSGQYFIVATTAHVRTFPQRPPANTGRYVLRFGVTGIDHQPITRGLVVCRLQDIVPGQHPPIRDLFGPGELPSFYIFGYGGETVTLVVNELFTGEVVAQETFYIPMDTNTSPTFQLNHGAYRAVLTVSGITVHTALFNIQR